jgi:hypothetical protein
VSTKYFNVKNGMATGGLLVSEANVTLGNVSNLHISGGSTNYLLSTNGLGTLSWVNPSSTQSPAPMPIVINDGDTLVIPEFYQGLFGTTITVDGNLEIDGALIDVSGQGPAGTVGQIQYNGDADFGATKGFTFDPASGNMAVPGSINSAGLIRMQTYSKTALRAITGVIGTLAIVTDSNPEGQLAYWNYTDSCWSYVCNNTAV